MDSQKQELDRIWAEVERRRQKAESALTVPKPHQPWRDGDKFGRKVKPVPVRRVGVKYTHSG